jgi:hypothetical protein
MCIFIVVWNLLVLYKLAYAAYFRDGYNSKIQPLVPCLPDPTEGQILGFPTEGLAIESGKGHGSNSAALFRADKSGKLTVNLRCDLKQAKCSKVRLLRMQTLYCPMSMLY